MYCHYMGHTAATCNKHMNKIKCLSKFVNIVEVPTFVALST
jgi:hypothetical protein